jgi:heat-inducible transcriptional repressor
MDELTPRQQLILGLIVREYVAGAQPVGSRAVESYGLGVSSATIRNEMAALEEAGYLTHPHTSAGRVPTAEGYRYFVERLMREFQLPLDDQRLIRHQFHQVGVDLEQWMQLAASVLARTAQSAAVVTSPRIDQCRLKHLELIAIRETMSLLIIVLEGGMVYQRMLTVDEPIAQDTLTQIANRLNDLCAGASMPRVAACRSQVGAFEQQVLEIVVQVMTHIDDQANLRVYRDGLINILQQPEFAEPEVAQKIVRVLEERTVLEELMAEAFPLDIGGVQVIIGGEGRWDELKSCSFVISPYGLTGTATGALGVLGPVRMSYSRAISTVRYVAALMTDLFRDLYGEG